MIALGVTHNNYVTFSKITIGLFLVFFYFKLIFEHPAPRFAVVD